MNPEVETPPEPGTLVVAFEVAGFRIHKRSHQQKMLAVLLGQTLKEKVQYVRQYYSGSDRGFYEVGNWAIHGNALFTGRFRLSEMEWLLRTLQTLDDAGLYPEFDIRLTYYPDTFDLQDVVNLQNILEVRRELIERSLHLLEPMMIVITYGLRLSIVPGSFSYRVVEAAACLINQASLMALSTKKTRMKPCDMSNPKFQMRSWLLRLGFIGEQFERPRRTLLEGLEGDTAFFNEDQKKQAVARRKAKRMNGGNDNGEINAFA